MFFFLCFCSQGPGNEPQFQAARLFGHRTQGCSQCSPSPQGATPLKHVLPPCADGMLPSGSCGPTCWKIVTASFFLPLSSFLFPLFSFPFPLLFFSSLPFFLFPSSFSFLPSSFSLLSSPSPFLFVSFCQERPTETTQDKARRFPYLLMIPGVSARPANINQH